jgi:MFS transporter, YNFM family, putative membrane transport protein
MASESAEARQEIMRHNIVVLHESRLPTFPVVLAGFAAFLDLYATQPLLPLLARTFGATTFQVGLTITVPVVAVALAAPAVGRLADHFGLRRIIITSAVLLAVATALAATATSLAQLIVWRFFQGVVTPGIFASTIAYVHEVWPASRVSRGTAAYMSGTVVGGFTGRAVAGIVAADSTWHMSFVALAILNGAVAAALWLWMPAESAEHRPKALGADISRATNPMVSGERRLGNLLRNRRLVATFAVGFCVLFTQVAMFTYVTFFLAAPPFNLSTVALGWLFVVYLVGAAITPLSGAWVDRYGHRAGLASAMAIGGTGALLTLVPALPAIIAGLALCSTGVFIAQATSSSYIGAVTTRDRGLAVGVYSTFYYGGGSAGGALPALFWSRGGWPACVALVFAVQAIGAAISFTQWTPTATAPAGDPLPPP